MAVALRIPLGDISGSGGGPRPLVAAVKAYTVQDEVDRVVVSPTGRPRFGMEAPDGIWSSRSCQGHSSARRVRAAATRRYASDKVSQRHVRSLMCVIRMASGKSTPPCLAAVPLLDSGGWSASASPRVRRYAVLCTFGGLGHSHILRVSVAFPAHMSNTCAPHHDQRRKKSQAGGGGREGGEFVISTVGRWSWAAEEVA